MPCPFYGRHAVQHLKLLVNQHGNQCALITSAYTPCKMETAGQEPDLENCDWNHSGRALEFAKFAGPGDGNTDLFDEPHTRRTEYPD